MDFTVQCASQSIGPFSQLFSLTIQFIISFFCTISPPSLWPADYGPTAVTNSLGSYDYIICGAGSAGSVIANRLSANPTTKVLLLEAGIYPSLESEIPNEYLSLQGTVADWNFRTESSVNYSLSLTYGCNWSRGKMLGGTAGLSNMLYQRGRDNDYDEWQKLGNANWNYQSVLPSFLKSEGNLNFNDMYHSQSGPWKVQFFPNCDSQTKAILTDALTELNVQAVPDFNAENKLGYGVSQATIDMSRRFSPAKAFLVPVKDRPNLQVIHSAFVEKLVIKNKKVVAVEFVYKDKNYLTVNCSKEVIVSCGTVNTPKLLMLSGIGPKKHLKSLGITVIKDLKVGENLQDQLKVSLYFKLNNAVTAMTETDRFNDLYNYAAHNTGPLTCIGVADLLQYNNYRNKTGYPNTMVSHLSYQRGAYDLPINLRAIGYKDDIYKVIYDSNQECDVLVSEVTLLKPNSRGKIELKATDPTAPPIISPNYLSEPDDIWTLVREIKFQEGLVQTESFKKNSVQFIQLPICDKFEYKSDSYWECYIRHMSTTGNNPVGTTKMGPTTDKDAVVNARLKVKGIKALRIAGSCIMPVAVRANSNAPTVMIGERVSDFILSGD